MHCIDMQIHIATLVEGTLAVPIWADVWHFTRVHTDMREQFVDTREYLHATFIGYGLLLAWISGVEY